MKRILVASDLSIRSDRAVGRAVRIAARLDVPLTALYVVDSAIPDELAEMVKTKAQDRLKQFITSRQSAEKIDVEVMCVIGDPVMAIHDAVRETGADLLVLGVHRPRAFLDSFRETTMERLVRTAAKPTLLVTDAPDHDYANVLAGVDMSPASARAIKCAHKVVPQAAISLFHAMHIPFKGLTGDADSAARMKPFVTETEAALDTWIATANFPDAIPRPTIIEGSPTQVLTRSMSKSRPDLLALGTNSRSGIGLRVLGGFTADLVRDPPCDLLVSS